MFGALIKEAVVMVALNGLDIMPLRIQVFIVIQVGLFLKYEIFSNTRYPWLVLYQILRPLDT